MAKKKEKDEPLLKPDKWNKVRGEQLVDMGYRVDSDGYLIATTQNYEVWLTPGNWRIYQPKNKPKQKEG